MHLFLRLILLTTALRADGKVKVIKSRSEFPYLAAIFVNDKYHTAGIIIGCRYVLITPSSTILATGGNTARSIDLEDVKVVTGSIFNIITCKSRVFEVAKMVLHKDFGPATDSSDIALLKLKTFFPKWLKNTIRPMPISQIGEKSEVVGSKCSITTWGKGTYQGHKNVPMIMVIDDVTVISNQTCKNQSWPDLPSGSLCADKPKNLPCYDVRGSPFLCKGYLQGLVSRFDYNNCTRPVVITDLAVYKHWIIETIIAQSRGYSCMKTTKNEMKIRLMTLFVIYIFLGICGWRV